MQSPVKSIIAGVLSGVASYFVSLQVLAYTNALAMPSWASLAAWNALVVLALAGLLGFGAKTLAAWLLGAILASMLHRRLRTNSSSKPTALPGAA